MSKHKKYKPYKSRKYKRYMSNSQYDTKEYRDKNFNKTHDDGHGYSTQGYSGFGEYYPDGKMKFKSKDPDGYTPWKGNPNALNMGELEDKENKGPKKLYDRKQNFYDKNIKPKVEAARAKAKAEEPEVILPLEERVKIRREEKKLAAMTPAERRRYQKLQNDIEKCTEDTLFIRMQMQEDKKREAMELQNLRDRDAKIVEEHYREYLKTYPELEARRLSLVDEVYMSVARGEYDEEDIPELLENVEAQLNAMNTVENTTPEEYIPSPVPTYSEPTPMYSAPTIPEPLPAYSAPSIFDAMPTCTDESEDTPNRNRYRANITPMDLANLVTTIPPLAKPSYPEGTVYEAIRIFDITKPINKTILDGMLRRTPYMDDMKEMVLEQDYVCLEKPDYIN